MNWEAHESPSKPFFPQMYLGWPGSNPLKSGMSMNVYECPFSSISSKKPYMLRHVFALGCGHLLPGLHRVSPEGFQPKTGVDSMKDLPSAKRSVAPTRRTGALGECRDQVSAKRNTLENARDFQEFARAVKKVVRPDHFVDLVDVFLKRTKL